MPIRRDRSTPDRLPIWLRILARARQARTLARLRRRRFAPPQNAPDSVSLLREDRRR